MTHPYQHLPDHCFWSRSVTWSIPGQLDPVVNPRWPIEQQDQVATMGSCFAQHLSRHLQREGIEFLVTESGPDGCSPEQARKQNYGIFSARYGNVYTIRQAVQLIQRALGEYAPMESIWKLKHRYVDPFRPGVEPEGWASEEEVYLDRNHHLSCVQKIFETADVLVFTLGLTEAWRGKQDGAIFPLAPGVQGGEFDKTRYEFVNFRVAEVIDDLFQFCELVRSLRSNIRILLTVSPVPLAATYENTHVLTSTTYSKSVLRVAAEEAKRKYPFVEYFPSYEIITSAGLASDYFEADLRHVADLGVSHVMRIFSKHFLGHKAYVDQPRSLWTEPAADVVCDEETIERSMKQAGY